MARAASSAGCARWALLPCLAAGVGLWMLSLFLIFQACGVDEDGGIPKRAFNELRSRAGLSSRSAALSRSTVALARELVKGGGARSARGGASEGSSAAEPDLAQLVQELATRVLQEAGETPPDVGAPGGDVRSMRGSVRGEEGRGRGAAGQAPDARPPTPPRPPEVFTQQTCYIASDESEFCTFQGPLCFDGAGPVVVVPVPVRTADGQPHHMDDYTSNCMDPRYYEPTGLEDGGCSLIAAGERKSFDTTRPMDPQTGYAMGMKYKRWGPQGRNGMLFFREASPSELVGADPVAALLAGADASGRTPFPPDLSRPRGVGTFSHESAPNLTIAARTLTSGSGLTIDWLPHPLWLAGIDGQWASNPFHWWSKVGALYDARRANASVEFGDHPDDGYIQPRSAADVHRLPSVLRSPAGQSGGASFSRANTVRYKVGPQWRPLPDLRAVIFAGDGAKELQDESALGSWFSSTLRLATPPGTVYTFGSFLASLGPRRLVCSAHGGAIPGSKTKWFTGRGDASMWRQYAYMATGLSARGVRPHPKYPPRQITLVDRQFMNGRGVYNRDAVIAAIRDTGLPYEIVASMASLNFSAQVALMSRTGILVASHGAALANAMFLPAHAVVVEMFPYGMKKNTYRHLAALVDLTYFPLYSWEKLPHTQTEIYGVQLMNEEYYWKRCTAVNISSIDALNEHACNAASKNYPILADIVALRDTLRDGVDIIGAYSLANPVWADIAERDGIKPAPLPLHIVPTVHGRG